ncbi:zincin [Atractiella rhizophila]|nr:zincin [Atractiella rhizophila]
MVFKLIPLLFATGALAAPGVLTAPSIVRCGATITPEQAAQANTNFLQALHDKGLTIDDFSHEGKKDSPLSARAVEPINVYFHNIYATEDTQGGYLTDDEIDQHITTLNDQMAATGTSYNLVRIDRTQNEDWFNGAGPVLDADTGGENDLAVQMKNSLRTGGPGDLNLYTVAFRDGGLNGLLGYATFPWDYQTAPELDGVVYRFDTGPGGAGAPFDEGKTLAHEAGHWLGLFHVFQGGCDEPGDYVPDTPPQYVASSGCPVGQDSCPAPGVDSIHNYMDYSDDACLNEWTQGQVTRLTALIATYRGIV